MRYVLALHPRNIGLYVLALTLVFLVACGAAAPAAPVAPPPAAEQQVDTPAQPAQPAPQQPAAPVAQPTPTPIVPQATVPSGTLNVGEKELGRFSGLPKNGTNPALFVISTVLTEGLVTQWEPVASKVHPMLAESWSVSDDYLVWTFNLRKGVQFHKGYGEMTAEDVAWSYVEGWAKNETHVRYDVLQRFWTSPDGYVEVKDSHTLEVHTGVPMSQPLLFDMARNPGGSGTWIGSKRQVEDVGEAAADRMIAATGSWEIVDHQPGQFWKMQAVPDHWRQTPHFAELVFWEIPEESSRLAGFQTGQLDTFSMAFDSIPLVESIPGASIMRVPNTGIMTLRFYGMYHLDAGTPNQRAAYNPDFAWISASADVN
jgi:ABC-type transport system substrate-binding protein